jgi:hypothetical protein
MPAIRRGETFGKVASAISCAGTGFRRARRAGTIALKNRNFVYDFLYALSLY